MAYLTPRSLCHSARARLKRGLVLGSKHLSGPETLQRQTPGRTENHDALRESGDGRGLRLGVVGVVCGTLPRSRPFGCDLPEHLSHDG